QDVIFGYGPGGVPAKIVGIVRNYHQRSLKEDYDPMLYCYPAHDNWSYFSVRMSTEHLSQTLATISEAYKAIFPGILVIISFSTNISTGNTRAISVSARSSVCSPSWRSLSPVSDCWVCRAL